MTTLGSVFAVPVEIVPFGWETTVTRLRELGFAPERRMKDDGPPYITDGQHYIVHCELAQSGLTPEQAAERLKATVGVVEHGLFLGMANRVVIGGTEGIQYWKRHGSRFRCSNCARRTLSLHYRRCYAQRSTPYLNCPLHKRFMLRC